MKFLITLASLLLVTESNAFLGFGDKEPKELEQLKKANHKVKVYESFEEIPSVTPVPGKFRLKLGTLIRMAVFKKEEIQYDIAEPKEYNDLEKKINSFFIHPGIDRSLKLLTYARQLNEGHPYRINPFLPYFTLRKENEMLANEKTGPAAVVNELFKQRGSVEGKIKYMTPNNQVRTADVKYKESSLPKSGLMLLFDADFLSVNDLISHPKANVLQDVVFHELTHVWHNELLDKATRDRSTVRSNMSENGHDAMIVSNPTLAFGEGLAEGFEALYGSAAAQYSLLTSAEREQFFGRFTQRGREELDFLVNRQVYIRRNSYLYNLYDFNKCALREVQGPSTADIGQKVDVDNLVEQIIAGREVKLDELFKSFDWQRYQRRFYGGTRASTTSLMANCEIDSPARLESKEGFVATLVYNLIYSGAFVDSDKLPYSSLGMKGKEGKEAFKNYIVNSESWEKLWSGEPSRNIASENERLKQAERIFLLGFRNLVVAIKNSKATSISDVLNYSLSSKSPFSEDIKLKIAYQVMKVTKGVWFNAETQVEKKFVSYFATPSSIRDNSDLIQDELRDLLYSNKIDRAVERLGKTPDVYVAFKSKMNGSTRRINANLAYHIDLVDMFDVNNKEITKLANELKNGAVFKNAEQFISFAESFGQGGKARQMVELAESQIKEVRKLERNFTIDQLQNHSF
jgi:hypothetical protein